MDTFISLLTNSNASDFSCEITLNLTIKSIGAPWSGLGGPCFHILPAVPHKKF